jgi:hypothetical protein
MVILDFGARTGGRDVVGGVMFWFGCGGLSVFMMRDS